MKRTNRIPDLRPDPPRDPRSRKVVSTGKRGPNIILKLECGHEASRRFVTCKPDRVLCVKCPTAGGMGR